MKCTKIIGVLLLGIVGSSGCGTSEGCQAPEPTLTAIQTDIFDRRCAFSGCHGNGSAKGGLSLEAGESRSQLVNAPSMRSDLPRVSPGDPDGSFLVVKLTTASGEEGQRMPLGGAALCAAEIDAIRAWIAAGAPDD